jgi:site-specific DNA recombinase
MIMERGSSVRRCAIYTRKSSEEGLEQDFNSLHAQREACEAFIKSQQRGRDKPPNLLLLTMRVVGNSENRTLTHRGLQLVDATMIDNIHETSRPDLKSQAPARDRF